MPVVMLGTSWTYVDDETAERMIARDLERFDYLERRSPTSGNRRQMERLLDQAEEIATQLGRSHGRVSKSAPTRHEKDWPAQQALRAAERVLELDGLTIAWDCGDGPDCLDGGGYGHNDDGNPRVIHLNPRKIKTDQEAILTAAHEAWHANKRIAGRAYSAEEERDAEGFAKYIHKMVNA